jgi:hypothetical protein
MRQLTLEERFLHVTAWTRPHSDGPFAAPPPALQMAGQGGGGDGERRRGRGRGRDGAGTDEPPSPPADVGPPFVDDGGLDELSNSVVDLVNAGRLHEALAVSNQLLHQFPDVVDGLERCAMVYAAMGDHALAADFYRKALAFVTDPVRRDRYEQGTADFYREQAEKEERLAGQG